MSELDTGLDEEMESFAHLITGEDATPSTDETDESDTPAQDESGESNTSESDMPDGAKEGDTDKQDADKSADGDDKDGEKGNEENAGSDTEKDDDAATEWKPPETVPYGRFSARAKALRQRERDLRKANKELAELKKQNEIYAEQLEANKRQAESDDYELREVPTEFTPELLERVREGDPEAIADHASIVQRQLEASQKADSGDNHGDTVTDTAPAETWLDYISNEAISDTLDYWQDDDSDAGVARLEIAREVEMSMASDPESQTLSADEIGKRLIERTNAEINRRADAMAVQQVEENKTEEQEAPASLSDAGTNRSDKVDFLNLEGQALVDALDATDFGE